MRKPKPCSTKPWDCTSKRAATTLFEAANVRLGYGRFLHGQGRVDEARSVLAEALTIAEKYLSDDMPELERYRSPLN